jgi:hypothetical protein
VFSGLLQDRVQVDTDFLQAFRLGINPSELHNVMYPDACWRLEIQFSLWAISGYAARPAESDLPT